MAGALYDAAMPDLPVMLNVRERRVVVVGGGATASRRVASLVECGGRVVVIAPQVTPQIEKLRVEVHRRAYQASDLEGAFLVVIATDDRQVNEAVHREAASGGVLVNRTDESARGDVAVMAHGRQGEVTVAVSTGGGSAQAAAAIRDELLGGLDESWITLLRLVGGFREQLRRVPESPKRQAALRRLADGEALGILKTGGEAALREHWERIVMEAGQA